MPLLVGSNLPIPHFLSLRSSEITLNQGSFYGKLKFELWNLNRFPTLAEAIEAIHLYIYYYNNNRIHTSLKMAPAKFAKLHS